VEALGITAALLRHPASMGSTTGRELRARLAGEQGVRVAADRIVATIAS
jgi:hypothetical protein